MDSYSCKHLCSWRWLKSVLYFMVNHLAVIIFFFNRIGVRFSVNFAQCMKFRHAQSLMACIPDFIKFISSWPLAIESSRGHKSRSVNWRFLLTSFWYPLFHILIEYQKCLFIALLYMNKPGIVLIAYRVLNIVSIGIYKKYKMGFKTGSLGVFALICSTCCQGSGFNSRSLRQT